MAVLQRKLLTAAGRAMEGTAPSPIKKVQGNNPESIPQYIISRRLGWAGKQASKKAPFGAEVGREFLS